ncbi:MAG: YggS family pyridoxal phosphate-dependent enzyme [Eubacteriales bacterium]|nr:YggS family pyridoxal phosphate-dependent enzyme [Eubacteriales bacterium]
MSDRATELRENFTDIKLKIQEQALKAGRDPEEVHLIAVSKTHPMSDILAVRALGHKLFGENKVQELVEKMEAAREEVTGQDLAWHLIGTLQRNKVRFVVGRVALIHSVHNLKLLKQLERLAAESDLEQDILLQVNVAKEASKHGFLVDELAEAYNFMETCPHLHLRGLMTMAPAFDNPEDALPVFQTCRKLYGELQEVYGQEQINTLSMGMSADFAQAIAAGATHVRVGSHIFGARDYSKA